MFCFTNCLLNDHYNSSKETKEGKKIDNDSELKDKTNMDTKGR